MLALLTSSTSKETTMEIVWTIGQLERQAADGLVTVGHYRVTATDGDYTASTYGTISFERGDTFIAFDQLTERDVISWVKSKLDPAAVELSLKAQIDQQKSPPVLSGVPWAAE